MTGTRSGLGLAFAISVVCASIVVGSAAGTATQPEHRWRASAIGYQPTLLVQLGVSDLDRAIAFYCDVLDFDLELRNDAIRWARVKPDIAGVTIGLGVREDAAGSGTVSINWAVGDIDAARKLLESRGVVFLGPTVTVPGVVRLADFTDPDGNRIRLAGHPGSGKDTEDE